MNTTQFASPSNGIPTSQLDPYSDEALVEPWGTYMALQNLGSAVWLEKYKIRSAIDRDEIVQIPQSRAESLLSATVAIAVVISCINPARI